MENISEQLAQSADDVELSVEVGLDFEIVIPDVDDTESGGGLSADVGGWGDEIIVDLY